MCQLFCVPGASSTTVVSPLYSDLQERFIPNCFGTWELPILVHGRLLDNGDNSQEPVVAV